jgi:thioredoxin reductase (NADPH)
VIKGAEHLEAVVVEENGAQRTIETDYFILVLRQRSY